MYTTMPENTMKMDLLKILVALLVPGQVMHVHKR